METLAARLKDLHFPHVCLFHHFEVTPTIAYMVRPYIYASLHERATLRPFLSLEEKLWIAFQILVAVDLTHRSGVRHGDFKTENILVTSWNWVLLTDFAPYKPVYIDITNTGAPSAFKVSTLPLLRLVRYKISKFPHRHYKHRLVSAFKVSTLLLPTPVRQQLSKLPH